MAKIDVKKRKKSLKMVKSSHKKYLRNISTKSSLKTVIKKANDLIIKDPITALPYVKNAIVALDKAKAKGIIHKNQASRKKSRLILKYNQAKLKST